MWHEYTHFGKIPDDEERFLAAKTDKNPYSLPTDPSVASPDFGIVEPATGEEIAYVIVELCCVKESRLSEDRYARHNGKPVIRIRLTEETDMTSASGLKKAGELVKPILVKFPYSSGEVSPAL